MNQILVVNKKRYNRIYKVQLVVSLISIIIFISYFFIYKYNIKKEEKSSEILLNNYSVSKLYNEPNQELDYSDSERIIGIIEIPKIDISYPIFANLTDDLLKISPCRISGYMPSYLSNLCIAGHNYDNGKFFSNLNKLNLNDNIYIYDNHIKKFNYIITDIYEVDETDLSPVTETAKGKAILTLITCNNINKKRLIIKSKLI